MENDILDCLVDLKYTGPLNNPENLKNAIEGGAKSIEYTNLVSSISKELKALCNLEEEVNAITSSDDSNAFLMELSSFLKELGCPYENLTIGHLSDRLNTKDDKLLLLDYLLSELMASRMIKATQPDSDNELSLKLYESETAKYLKSMLLSLQFNKPPSNITPAQLFQKVENKLREICKRSSQLIGKPAFTGKLSEKQWDSLNCLQKKMHDEYTIRREMLIKRCQVTIQSFQWSDRMKDKIGLIESTYKKKESLMNKDPDVDISDLLAARDDITIIEKTSSASVRKNTQTSINKVIIGQVPDRGGRPNEQEPPPPEMPSWQQRSAGGGTNQRGRGGNYGGGSGQNYGANQGNSGGNQSYSGGNQGYRGGNQGYSDGNQGYSGGNQSYSGGNQNYTGGNKNYGQGNFRGNDRNYGNSNRNQNPGNYSSGDNRGFNNYNQRAPMSYADQYVQDSARNQEYGGRSNYNRGGSQGGRGGNRSGNNRGSYR